MKTTKIVFIRTYTFPLDKSMGRGLRAILGEVPEKFSTMQEFASWYKNNQEGEIDISKAPEVVRAIKQGVVLCKCYKTNGEKVLYNCVSEDV